MFHQVFICNTTGDPEDRSIDPLMEEDTTEDKVSTELKEEQLTTGRTEMGLLHAEDFKMAIEELKSDPDNVVTNQLVKKIKAQDHQMDVETSNFLDVTPISSTKIDPSFSPSVVRNSEEVKVEEADVLKGQVKMEIEDADEPREDAGSSGSEETKVDNGAVITQDSVGTKNSIQRQKNKPLRTINTKEISSSTMVIDLVSKAQLEESSLESRMQFGDMKCKKNDDELRSMYAIKECSVVLNHTISEYSSQNKNFGIKQSIKVKQEAVLLGNEDNSTSDREDYFSDDDDRSSGSDWEDEYLGELRKCQKRSETLDTSSVKNITFTSSVMILGDNSEQPVPIKPQETLDGFSTETNNIQKLQVISKKKNICKDSKPQPKLDDICVSFNKNEDNRVKVSLQSKLPFRTDKSRMNLQFIPKNKVKNNKFVQERLKGKDKLSTPELQKKIKKCKKQSSKVLPKLGASSDNKDNSGELSSDTKQNIARTVPVDLPIYHCKKCDKLFEIRQSYLVHLRKTLCSGYRHKAKYECRFCDRKFTGKLKLEYHENYHTNARPFKCSDCEKCFNSKTSRHMHHKREHLDKKITCYLCCFCGHVSTNSEHILAHEEEHRLPEGTEAPKPFKCLVCNRGFISKYMLQKHEKNHSMFRKCSMCTESFKTRTQLKNHLEAAHSLVKIYNCKECGMQFKSASCLGNHRLAHSTVLSFFCEICDKGFKRKWNLTQHMITHSEERPLACPECGDCFKRVTHLKQHTAAFHGDGRK